MVSPLSVFSLPPFLPSPPTYFAFPRISFHRRCRHLIYAMVIAFSHAPPSLPSYVNTHEQAYINIHSSVPTLPGCWTCFPSPLPPQLWFVYPGFLAPSRPSTSLLLTSFSPLFSVLCENSRIPSLGHLFLPSPSPTAHLVTSCVM